MDSFPFELTASIVHELDTKRDVVALALCCSRLKSIADTSGALFYSRIVAVYGHTGLWKHLIANPHLCACVRELDIHHFRPRSGTAGSDITFTVDRFPKYTPVSYENSYGCIDPTVLARCLQLMTGLRHLTAHLPSTGGDAQQDMDMASAIFKSTQMQTGLATLDIRVRHNTSLERHPISIDSALWSISGLRVLNLRLTHGVSMSYWGKLCEMMHLSPGLEELYLPEIRLGGAVATTAWPRLQHLRVLHVPDMHTPVAHKVLQFMHDHPELEELAWESAVHYEFLSSPALPSLPRLVRLKRTSPLFARMLLSRHAAESLNLEALDGFDLDADTLPLLKAIDKRALRSLALFDVDSLETLLDAAQTFPNLRELRLGRRAEEKKLRLKDVRSVLPDLQIVGSPGVKKWYPWHF